MSFKTFDLAHDVASIVSAINEVVSLSSSLFAGGAPNVKKFQNISSASLGFQLGGYWQTVYDASAEATSSTALVDMTFGFNSGSSSKKTVMPTSGSYTEKMKVYREISNVLQGDPDRPFVIGSDGGNGYKNDCFFMMVKRGLMKDELKKGSVSVVLSGTAGAVTASDAGAATNFKQTVGGDYAPLVAGGYEVGQVWYQAGVIVIPASASGLPWNYSTDNWFGTIAVSQSMAENRIDDNVDGLRAHVQKIGFHNQTNLYSTVYFCRATNTEFNYSSNPTFLDDEHRIRVTSGSNVLQTRTYITTIGLYDANDNLLAVGKMSKPITKSPDNEAIFRIRLDY